MEDFKELFLCSIVDLTTKVFNLDTQLVAKSHVRECMDVLSPSVLLVQESFNALKKSSKGKLLPIEEEDPKDS